MSDPMQIRTGSPTDAPVGPRSRVTFAINGKVVRPSAERVRANGGVTHVVEP